MSHLLSCTFTPVYHNIFFSQPPSSLLSPSFHPSPSVALVSNQYWLNPLRHGTVLQSVQVYQYHLATVQWSSLCHGEKHTHCNHHRENASPVKRALPFHPSYFDTTSCIRMQHFFNSWPLLPLIIQARKSITKEKIHSF